MIVQVIKLIEKADKGKKHDNQKKDKGNQKSKHKLI